MSRILKILFFAVIVRPVVLVILGLNIRNRALLPTSGPAVLAANHNSHLDTLVLMSLYPLSLIHRVRPVGAADYFFANRYIAWFSRNVIGVIPLDRSGSQNRDELFTGCIDALAAGDIVILFPEGSRGDAEQMSDIKKGLYHLLKEAPGATISPIVMRGLGRALPRGEALLVPFNCDVVIGQALPAYDTADEFIAGLTDVYEDLFGYCVTRV
jgi:1-acyl-sn-glycerol-3-phosphate acyltransferase